MQPLLVATVLTLLSSFASAQADSVIEIKKHERTPSSIVIEGAAKIVPPGTKMWVTVKSINGRPVNEDRDTIKSVGDVFVEKDGTFTATIQRYGSLSGYAFPDGNYRLEFYAGFDRAWQSLEVARAAGVAMNAQGQSESGEPRTLPKSPDLVREDVFGERVRVLRAFRTISIRPGTGLTSQYKTRSARLEVVDIVAAKNPVRTIPATDLLVREVAGKVGRLTRNQAISVVCVGDFKNGFGLIADDLAFAGGGMNPAYKTNYSTKIFDICHQQEDALSSRKR